jgi:hypothetical protein
VKTEPFDQCRLFVCGSDDEGQPDFHAINENFVPGTQEDLQEIAHKYSERLKSGVPPEELFRDLEEETRLSLRKLAEKFRQQK